MGTKGNIEGNCILRGYGNNKVFLVSGGERAIVAIKDRVMPTGEADAIPNETRIGEHSESLAEGMVRTVREHAMAIVSQMESGAGGEVNKDADIKCSVR